MSNHENEVNKVSANEPANDSHMDDGGTVTQISTASQLEGNVSPTTSSHFDNGHLLENNNNSNNNSNNNNNNNNNNSNSNNNSPNKSESKLNNRNLNPISNYQYNNNNNNINNNNSNHNGSSGSINNNNNNNIIINKNHQSFISENLLNTYQDDHDHEDYNLNVGGSVIVAGGTVPNSITRDNNNYWPLRSGAHTPTSPGHQSRFTPTSILDNMSENSEQSPIVPLVRSKSRPELSSNAQLNSIMSAASRYSNLSYWKARRVVFYRNGDPFFPGIELRYRPGRDITSLDSLLDKISPKMDLPRGARYVFSLDGDRKYHLDELEDGASYVVSSFKAFKVSQSKTLYQYAKTLIMTFNSI